MVGVVGIGVSNAVLVSESNCTSGSGSGTKSSLLAGFALVAIVCMVSPDIILSSKSICLRCQRGLVSSKYAQSCGAVGIFNGSAVYM